MRDVTAGGAWTSIAATMTFGGALGWTNVPSGRLFVHTQHRPGNNAYHAIWAAMSNEWQIVHQANANGRVGQTAMIDVPNVINVNLNGNRQMIVGTRYSTHVGPIRLLQNTWFQAGADQDGDGLGAPLEEALKTCDRTTSPDPSSGFSCADLPGCDVPSSDLCQSSLRDSDHDGLRDDLETWGYDDPLLHIARWGADPSRMDVFIELDSYDQQASTPLACEGFESLSAIDGLGGDLTGNTPFFTRMKRVFDDLPESLEFNPHGSVGIQLHYDVGIPNPDPTDTRWGAWGGGNSCFIKTNNCDYIDAYFNGCAGAGTTFSDIRKWVFFYGVDAATGGGGQASGGRIAFVAKHLSHHAHETGHLGHLNHQGPRGSAAAHGHFGNYRPTYPSRINYGFQDVGEPTGIDSSDWWQVTFSSGQLVAPMSNLAAPEVCPFPSEDISRLGITATSPNFVPGEWTQWNAGTTCWDVDWNRDGTVAGTTYLKRLSERHRIDRYSGLSGLSGTAVAQRVEPAAWSMAAVGDVLLFSRIERYGTDEVVFRADSDADCELHPLDIRGASLPLYDADYTTGGAYPGCIRPGRDDVRPGLRAMAADIVSGRAYVGGVLEEAAILVRNDFGTLRWEVLDVAPAANGTEMSFSYDSKGVIGTGISICEGCAEPALVRMPSTDATLLVYRDASGWLWERTLSPGAASWTSATAAISGGVQLTSNTAVALTARDGKAWMASTDGAGIIQLRERVGTNWVFRASLGSSAATLLRPSIVIADDVDLPSSRRMWVFMLRDHPTRNEVTSFRRSNLDDFTSFGSLTDVVGNRRENTAPTAFWDDRPLLAGAADLRLIRGQVRDDCASNADCASPATTCDTTLSRCRDGGGARVAATHYTPFTRGPSPGVYTDYNDWLTLRTGFCRSLEAKSSYAPDFTDGYVPMSYRTSQQCAPYPTFAEPTASGMSIVVESPANDETAHPWLYAVQPEVICDP
jgi:hypothetical protein